QPILHELRDVVHQACPEVEETMKWSFPHFMYKGILCSMASFKEHCAFGFWKGGLILDGKENKSVDAMGQFGRIVSRQDLPATRERRLQTSVEWLAQGKSRHWKYERC